MIPTQSFQEFVKPLVFILCLLPFLILAGQGLTHHLGANPIEAFTRGLGDWALRLLLITLTVTPLRRIFGWNSLLRLRRMLGLFTFFYACMHVMSYVILDQFFALDEILKDIIKRPFITIGFACFLLMIPLAATSTNKMIKRLGAKRWQALHKLVYLIALGAVLHYLWMVKADLRHPLWYGGTLAVLLGYRLWVNYFPVFHAKFRNAVLPVK